MTWTQFHDMHSGGGLKQPPYRMIYIEASEEVARVVFFNRFGHSPDRVSCTCCGEDYSVTEDSTLEAATNYERTTSFLRRDRSTAEEPLAEYVQMQNVLVIYEADIKPEERSGEVPRQGYVWVDE